MDMLQGSVLEGKDAASKLQGAPLAVMLFIITWPSLH
jgi:hypothetical protein